ncbi:hypothetical protein NMY22_g924 [Coprinellus aureogranulatus]|nr:hypothetical protein NMY22_g924 [Coprinellus aureogranulatus]
MGIEEFLILGVDDHAAVRVRVGRFQPNEGDCYIDYEQYNLDVRVELLPGGGRPVDIGPSPWIHAGYYEAPADLDVDWPSPQWTKLTCLKDPEFVGYQSRARVLEIVDALLDANPHMPERDTIRQWTYLASNWFNSHVRKNVKNVKDMEGLQDLIRSMALEGRMKSLSL